ncbi:MAG: HaeII family restriction endonuclease [Saprospiraceae bacterium]|nr:HaeII family restriction endonuclease [Saprospiraceae bacterium]
MSIEEAKRLLDSVIAKGRVHLYKPIQIAEILQRDRVIHDINLPDLETYRNRSKLWRDLVCLKLLGRKSTSSAKYQDDIFNAITPEAIIALGKENRDKDGIVEAYIYSKFSDRFTQMSVGLEYCKTHDKTDFVLREFIDLFWHEKGLKRSIDKIYEIIVYALFSALTEVLEVEIEISMNPDKLDILSEFEDFAKRIILLTPSLRKFKTKARINRVGVTNAADRGLDMWANFGLVIQIKHLSLTEELAKNIVTSVTADRIVIVCKDSEEKIILSLLNQIGWKSRIQSIITESDLIIWYEKGLRGRFANIIGDRLLKYLADEIKVEFPSSDNSEFSQFYENRGYVKPETGIWQ